MLWLTESGDFCGSSNVNRHFVEWLQKRIDREEWVDMLHYMSIDEQSFVERLTAAFEDPKKGFSGTPATTFVTIPDLRKSHRFPQLIWKKNIVLQRYIHERALISLTIPTN